MIKIDIYSILLATFFFIYNFWSNGIFFHCYIDAISITVAGMCVYWCANEFTVILQIKWIKMGQYYSNMILTVS